MRMSSVNLSSGSLTIIDPNLETMRLFWNGRELANVLSLGIAHTKSGTRRTTVRVVSPAKVSPALGAAEQLARLAIYDAMEAAQIDVLKV
jgi:hypothetical protein